MKALKIGLGIVALVVIVFLVMKWTGDSVTRPAMSSFDGGVANQFTEQINCEIDSLGSFPAGAFCDDLYKKVKYHIAEYHEQQKLADNANDNDRWNELLSKNLYSTYAAKFVEQAKFVFNRHEWKPEKLKIIRNELRTLKQSEYLEAHNEIDKELTEIASTLQKYDEINAFVAACENFEFADYDINDEFPAKEATDKIITADQYLNNAGNKYVGNCSRLKNKLKDIPQKIFSEYYSYLDIKIAKYHRFDGDEYHFAKKYSTQKDYEEAIYKPLRNQISNFYNDFSNLYGHNFALKAKEELLDKLKDGNNRTYFYYNSQKFDWQDDDDDYPDFPW